MTREICICIPTFKRPLSLARLLGTLPFLEGDFRFHVIVADNDIEYRQGLAVCRELASAGYPLRLTALESPERGISQTRNILASAALACPDCELIAMIDDDGWPDSNWIAVLAQALDDFGAELAGPALRHAYESAPEPGVESLNAETGENHLRHGPVPVLQRTGGVLIRRSVFMSMTRPWFLPVFGLTGGEDDDFFQRARAEGCRFAFSSRTAVTEWVPTTRATRKFLNQRAFAQGAAWAFVRRMRRPAGWSPALEVVKIIAGLGLGCVAYAACFWSPARRLRAEFRVMRAAGKFSGLRGRLVQSYLIAHGV